MTAKHLPRLGIGRQPTPLLGSLVMNPRWSVRPSALQESLGLGHDLRCLGNGLLGGIGTALPLTLGHLSDLGSTRERNLLP